MLFILNHIQQKIPFNSFSIGFDRIFSSLSEALNNVFQMNRSNIGIRRFTVCPRGRAHLESEYESVYSGTWVERFLCFNHFLIYQGPKYAVMLVVFLPSVHWNKIFGVRVCQISILRYWQFCRQESCGKWLNDFWSVRWPLQWLHFILLRLTLC